MTSHNDPPVMSVSMSIMTTDASKAGKAKAFKKESKAASRTHQKMMRRQRMRIQYREEPTKEEETVMSMSMSMSVSTLSLTLSLTAKFRSFSRKKN
jgi:hypothetical protein